MIASAVVIGIGAAFAYQELTAAPEYASSVTFFAESSAGAASDPASVEDRMAALEQVVTSDALADRVIALTGVPLTTSEVASRMSGQVADGTVLLTATATDSSADRALVIAKGVAATFGSVADELDPAATADITVRVVAEPALGADTR